MTTWILIANAAEAKILSTDNLRTGELTLIQELVHPESRKKVSDLIADKPGHYKTDTNIRGAYSKNNPKQVEAEHFAIQIKNELQSGWDKNQYKSLVIVTPAQFYGLVKKHFHFNSAMKVRHIPKDYTKYTLIKLHASLKEHLLI